MHQPNKRRGMRYHPPIAETCELVLAPFDTSTPRSALLHDQSHRGCSFLCVMDDVPKKGDRVLLKIGKPVPLLARVTYAVKASADVRHIGCEILDCP